MYTYIFTHGMYTHVVYVHIYICMYIYMGVTYRVRGFYMTH